MTDQVFFERLTNACHKLLPQNRHIYSYLRSRGISNSTIKEYKLGAFPEDLRDLFTYVSAKELREKDIVYCADKSPFSKHPIVIPICDSNGHPIAIGCRTVMPEEDRKKIGIPKYRNSKYHKTSYLFGLDHAINSIRKNNKVFVVEGYFDCISAQSRGAKNVVATCGTLFSYRQLIILSRYTDNICILFDNDEPGRKNAELLINKFSNHKSVNISCSFTPDGFKDLDEYLTNGGSFDYFEI